MMHRGIDRIAQTADEQASDRTAVVVRLLKYLRNYRTAVSLAFLFIIIAAFAQAAGPFLIGRAVDVFITGSDIPGLTQTVALLFLVYLIAMFAMRYQIYYMSWASQKVLAELRLEVMKKIHLLSLQDLEDEEAGDLMSRLVNDIDAINSFFSQGLAQFIGATFAIIGIVIAMFVLQWQLALAALSIVPLMVILTRIFSRLARRAFRRTRSTIGDVSADLQEEIVGVKVAQAFSRERINIDSFETRNAANRDANVSANAITSAFAPAMDILSTIDTAIVAGLGGYLAITGTVTVGVVIAFLQYVQNFFRPIQSVSQLWTLAQSAFAAAERVFELIDLDPKIKDRPDAEEMAPIVGEVRFDRVSFSYEADKPVLVDVSFTAPAGKTTAIVGPTGAGKTTLVSLLSRFYDVSHGAISIDGTDIRDVRQHSLRSQTGMVLQDPFLFSGTIMDNIRYGRLEASDEQVFQAAEAANAAAFIARLPQEYDTEVGERGALLSQGQRQLVTIARAILADPRILILDEATASVDTRTEVLIQEALGRLLAGRTSFVIAHRLSTVRNADQVIVLDQGRIVEQGTHSALMKLDGLYADLYNRQFYVPVEADAQIEAIVSAD